MFIEGENDAELDVNDKQDDTDTEGESETSSEGSEPETITLTKAERDQLIKDTRKDQDKRWKERLKLKEGDDEDSADSKKEDKVDTDERYDRLELKTEGVTSKKEQDIVLDYAKFKKISVLEALKAPGVKAELKELRDKASVPSPSRRTNGGVDTGTVEYWVEQYKRGGKSAPTVEMRRKVRQALQR